MHKSTQRKQGLSFNSSKNPQGLLPVGEKTCRTPLRYFEALEMGKDEFAAVLLPHLRYPTEKVSLKPKPLSWVTLLVSQ